MTQQPEPASADGRGREARAARDYVRIAILAPVRTMGGEVTLQLLFADDSQSVLVRTAPPAEGMRPGRAIELAARVMTREFIKRARQGGRAGTRSALSLACRPTLTACRRSPTPPSTTPPGPPRALMPRPTAGGSRGPAPPATASSLTAAPTPDPPTAAPAPRDGRNGITARCACPDSLTIRIRGGDAARLLGEHPLRCERCGERFTPAR